MSLVGVADRRELPETEARRLPDEGLAGNTWREAQGGSRFLSYTEEADFELHTPHMVSRPQSCHTCRPHFYR